MIIACEICEYMEDCPFLGEPYEWCHLEYFEPLPQFRGTTLANGSSDEAKI